MSRQLKFRAFYNQDIEFKELNLTFFSKYTEEGAFFICRENAELVYPFEVPFIDKNWIIQQYTGIIDKNNNEIYDGDILKIDSFKKPYVVTYSKFDASDDSGCDGIGFLIPEMFGKPEVIGNIFYNKDLL